MTKLYGGSTTIKLTLGKTLINVTWKQNEIWYLVRNRLPGEKIQKYEFIEKSSFGLLEGKVIFIEQ